MATRESINRVKIERFRVGRVPINAAETIYQGDLLAWDAANRRASKATSASGTTFIGMSDTKNPIETAGSTTFLSDSQLPAGERHPAGTGRSLLGHQRDGLPVR